ncbi:hypothetical protein Dxin01_03166 [Deinococcus xinjiangensis]|uniref:Uncharacterized protein n=1 Tax=Deinococcus xinjiangensis TaxID=457454 RepID=A0ABP9VDU4_9DEIO
MKYPLAVLWFTLSLLLVVGVVAFLAVARLSSSTPLAFSAQRCQESATFTVGGAKDEGGVLAVGAGFRMAGEGWLQARPCHGGLLTVTADGEVAGGAAPRLDIALDGLVITSEDFSTRRTAQITVPHGGVLTLLYSNDLYQADVRMAILSQPRIQKGACTTLSGATVPPESAGSWDIVSNSGSVVRASPPVTLKPCGAGILSLRVMGHSGGGVYPVVAFRQAGRLLKEVQTSEATMQVQLPVAAEAVEVFVTNPYARLLADRNLNVREIRLIPAR